MIYRDDLLPEFAARKLAEDCCKYGIENQDSSSHLARVVSEFGTTHTSMEDQRELMLGILGYQVQQCGFL